MMKAKSISKMNAGREMRLAKSLSAADAIGEIVHGQDCFILTFGQFSLIDALVHILDKVGPSDVTIATWTAADAHLERSAELVASSAITGFRMIVDRSFEGRQPGYCRHMRETFGDDCIRFARSHAKFMLIRSATHDVVVRTSMNLNENPRLENIEVSESREFADWFQSIADAIFAEVEAGEKRSQMLGLDEIPDTSPYKQVDAKHIPRESLNECETSHTIKTG